MARITEAQADDEWSNRGLEPEPPRTSLDVLRERSECDAEAGRIGWHEIGDRAAAACAAMSAFAPAVGA